MLDNLDYYLELTFRVLGIVFFFLFDLALILSFWETLEQTLTGKK